MEPLIEPEPTATKLAESCEELMARLKEELSRIEAALRDPEIAKKPNKWCQFYVARQALAWIKTPTNFMSPYGCICEPGGVQPLTPGIYPD